MKHNTTLLEGYNICLNAIFIMPVFIPFYRDHIGLSFQDFLIGEAVFAAVIVALEVPSGWLSDVWKRKNVLILSCAIWIAGFSVLIVADNLAMTIIAQSIIGVAVSLFSGTNTALLYDTLAAQGREAEYSRREGRRMAFMLYSIAFASIAGGFMYMVHPLLPLLATIAMAFPALFCCILLTEPPRYKTAVQGHPIKDMAITLRYALHGHKEIAFIIIFAALLFSGTKMIMWSQQPYYIELALPEYVFGFLLAGGFVFGGFSSQMAHRLDGRISNLLTLTLCLLAALMICILCGMTVGLHGVALLMIGGTCLYGIAMPRVNNAINIRIASDRRATILSTLNLLRELFFIPISLIAGWLVAGGGIGNGLWAVAGWLALAGLFIALWAWMKHRKNREPGVRAAC